MNSNYHCPARTGGFADCSFCIWTGTGPSWLCDTMRRGYRDKTLGETEEAEEGGDEERAKEAEA